MTGRYCSCCCCVAAASVVVVVVVVVSSNALILDVVLSIDARVRKRARLVDKNSRGSEQIDKKTEKGNLLTLKKLSTIHNNTKNHGTVP